MTATTFGRSQAVDWINPVSQYNADPSGASDSTAAIQGALNACPNGGVVYLPAGTYKTTGTLTVPIWVRLLGPTGDRAATFGAVIKPAVTFSGAAALTLMAGNAGLATGAIRLENLVIDGSSLSGGGVHGILAAGYVHGAVLHRLHVKSFPGDGIHTQSDGTNVPYSWTLDQVESSNNIGHGFYTTNLTDSTWLACRAASNTGDGYNLTATGASGANSRYLGCIAEGNATGFNIASSTSAFAQTFSGCSTQFNNHDGFKATSTATTGLIQITGCRFWEDGNNAGTGGGGYSGINLTGLTGDVLISGTSVLTNNTGTPAAPANGLSVTNCTGQVTVSASQFFGATTDISNGGGNTRLFFGSDVSSGTGIMSALTRQMSPVQRANYEPGDQGFLAWTGDPSVYVNTSATVSQTLYLMKVVLRSPVTVTNVHCLVSTAGATFTGAFMGFYNSAGTLLSSASAATPLASTGLATVPLGTPQPCKAGEYWVGLLVNGGTQPILERSTGLFSAANANLSSGHYRFATNGTAVTSLANITPASNSGTGFISFWAAVS